MSEVKKGPKKGDTTGSKNELSTGKTDKDGTQKADKTVPKKKPTQPESKKDLDEKSKPTDEKSKAKIDKKPSIEDNKAEPAKAAVKPDGKADTKADAKEVPKPEVKEDVFTSEITVLFKSITDEFQAVSGHFQGVLTDTLKKLATKEGWKDELEGKHSFFKAHEQLAKLSLSLVKDTFKQTNELFKGYEETLKRLMGIKTKARDFEAESDQFEKRVKVIQENIAKIFKVRCAEESKKASKAYETVTAASLEDGTKQRLLSANLQRSDLGSALEKSKDREGAADQSKAVKRQVAEDLHDVTFIGYKSFSEAQKLRRQEASKEFKTFKEYVATFDLKPCPDTILKGMGKLTLRRLRVRGGSIFGRQGLGNFERLQYQLQGQTDRLQSDR